MKCKTCGKIINSEEVEVKFDDACHCKQSIPSEEDFEEVVREDIINNMKHLENNTKTGTRGCGKPINNTLIDCGMHVFGLQLCPSCTTLNETSNTNDTKMIHNDTNNNSEDSKDCVHQDKDPEGIARLSPAVNSGSNHSSIDDDKDPDDLVNFLPRKPSDSGSDFKLNKKIWFHEKYGYFYPKKDVAEFIRLLKEHFGDADDGVIDKLTGEFK